MNKHHFSHLHPRGDCLSSTFSSTRRTQGESADKSCVERVLVSFSLSLAAAFCCEAQKCGTDLVAMASLAQPLAAFTVASGNRNLGLNSSVFVGGCSKQLSWQCRGPWQQLVRLRMQSMESESPLSHRSSRVSARAQEEELLGSAAGASGDSIVGEVAVLAEEPETEGVAASLAAKSRKPSALQKGGTLEGREAEGKDPSLATLQKQTKSTVTSTGEKFTDSRWIAGTWDIAQFTDGNGKVDWDAVIDAGNNTCACLFCSTNKRISVSSNTYIA